MSRAASEPGKYSVEFLSHQSLLPYLTKTAVPNWFRRRSFAVLNSSLRFGTKEERRLNRASKYRYVSRSLLEIGEAQFRNIFEYFQKRGLSINNRPLESFLSTKYTKRKDYSSEHIFQTPNLALQWNKSASLCCCCKTRCYAETHSHQASPILQREQNQAESFRGAGHG